MIYLHLRRKRFKRVPKKQCVICLLFAIIFLAFFINLFLPSTNMLQNTQHVELHSYQFESIYSRSRHSSGHRYNIYADETKYYFLIPYSSDEYERFRDEVVPPLESGQIQPATLIFATKQTLQDKLLNRHRILSFSIDGTTYLSLEQSKATLVWEYIGAWVGFLLIGGFCMGYIIITGLNYGVLELDRSSKRKN